MRSSQAAACLVLVLSGITVAGCTAVPGGPVHWGSDGRDADTLCSTVGVATPMLVADVLEAPPGEQIEVIDIEPVNPQRIEVSEIAIAPLDADSASIGNSPIPPEDDLTSSIWNARRPVAGYELAPGDRADVLVVAERTTDDPGSIENLRIRYRAGGIVYEKAASTFYLFAEDCAD